MDPIAGLTSSPFPHHSLTRIDGKPTAISVTRLRKEVYANASAIHSETNGDNGYLGLVMDPTTYIARTGTAFLAPVHPGLQADHANNATPTVIQAANRGYDRDKEIFRQFTKVKAELKQQILAAVNPTYYDVLEDDILGYKDVTIIQLLNHLQAHYATLTYADLENNRMSLSSPWNPDEPFENLWTKIKHHRAVANAGNEPLTNGVTIQ